MHEASPLSGVCRMRGRFDARRRAIRADFAAQGTADGIGLVPVEVFKLTPCVVGQFMSPLSIVVRGGVLSHTEQ